MTSLLVRHDACTGKLSRPRAREAIDPTAIDPAAIDPTAIDPAAIDPTAIDPAAIDPTAIDPPEIVRPEIEVAELLSVAVGLARCASRWPGMKRPRRRSWQLMVASEDFEAWVIGWPPGGAIQLHDHGASSGAVVVARGELVETVVTEHPHCGVATETTVLPESTSTTFGAAYVHDIVNLGTGPAVSVHVYAPRLTAMTFYEIVGGRLEVRDTLRYPPGGATP